MAEDVVSLTFLEAWRLRHRLDEEGGSPRPWLLGIATSVTRNMRRATRRHTAAADSPTRDEWIFDSKIKKGRVTSNTAILERAVADCAGQRP